MLRAPAARPHDSRRSRRRNSRHASLAPGGTDPDYLEMQGEPMDVTVEAARLLASRRRALAQHAAAEAVGEISEIDAALERIAAGTYGTCEICGHAIGRDRLRALPEVRRCVTCSG
jgi:DnaK suppressor protein